MRAAPKQRAWMMLAAMAAALAGDARAQDRKTGPLPADVVASSLESFAAMGFKMDARVVNIEASPAELPAWALGEASAHPQAGLFTLARGHGEGASCVVALRPSKMRAGAEARLALAASGLYGADLAAAWRLMLRHELGHCALAWASAADGAPDPFVSEPFADVFGADWTRRAEGSGAATAASYAQARARFGSGAHATAPALIRWGAAPGGASPCLAAWSASPVDKRTAAAACPKIGK